MKRHVVAGIALLGMAGCAQERTAQRPAQGYPSAVGLPPEVAPITQTINQGLPPPDRATVLASTGVGANKGPAQGRPIAPAVAPNRIAAGPSRSAEPPAGAAPSLPGPTLSTSLVAPPAGAPAAAVLPSDGAAQTSATAAVAGSTDLSAAQVAAAADSTRSSEAAPAAHPSEATAAPPAGPAAPSHEPAPVVSVAPSADPLPNPAPITYAAPEAAPGSAAAASVASSADPLASPAPTTAAAPEMVPGSAPSPIPLAETAGSAGPDPTTAAADPGPTPQPVPMSIPLQVTPSADAARSPAAAVPPPVDRRDALLGQNPAVLPSPDAFPASLNGGVSPPTGAGDAPPPAAAGSPSVVGTDVMPPIEAPPTGPVPITGPAVPALAPVEAPGPQAPPPGPARLADPLLGANPPIMPDMEAPVARPSPTAPGTKPAAPKAATADVMPPLEAAPLPAPVPAAPPPGELPPVVLPPAEAPPPVAPVPSLPAPQAAREGGAKRDSDLVRTGADPTAVPSSVTLRSDIKTPRMQPASEIAARVGDEVITMTELTSAMKERGRKQLAGQKLTREDVQMLASFTLNDLVDRSLVMQEAKRKLKDPKKYQTVVDAADNVFKEHEVPALMRKYRVDTERALRDALIADDSSYERARENFRYRFITGGYIEQQLSTKFKVDLPEKRAYYNEHLNEFNRPAQITWREVVVEVRKARSRTEAYHRAEAILARLRRGEDFAKVAATESDGPTKNAGGRWQTRPGGYAVSSVNRALEGLPVGQVSPIIEGPDSYHIVMVEERREAGPARFDEVQDEIQDAVAREKSDRITSQFIEKLRRQTYVWTRYAGTPNDPEVLRAKYAKARAGSR